MQLCDQPTSPLVLSWLLITAEQRSNPESSRVSELNSKAKASQGSETRLNNHMHHPSIGAACDKNRVVKLQLCLKDVAATADAPAEVTTKENRKQRFLNVCAELDIITVFRRIYTS